MTEKYGGAIRAQPPKTNGTLFAVVLNGLLMEAIKKALLWTYGRTTWQWDLLCVLILIFIFLTPKQWFENTEFTARKQALRRGYSTVLLESSGGTANLLPREDIEQRVRHLTNRPEAKIVNIRERRDPQTNQLTGYEVDIQ